jgi:predicted AlkP superfamily phosphohydrolase/phosphomutase
VDALIVSDHGARSMGGMFHVNQWLYDQGLLFVKDETRRRLRRSGLDRAYRLMPEWARRAAKPFTRQALGHHIAQSVDRVFDMRRTRAYMLSSGQLYFNVKGRDPQGIVEPGGEYEALAAQIRDGLSQVRDPLTDRRLEFEIWQRDDIWHGPYVDRAPDMLVQMSDPFYDKAANLSDHGSLFSTYGQHYTDFAGVHRRMGALLAVGPQIQPGTRLDRANILDVAPTALHVMGLPIPRDMDGQVLAALLRPDSESARRTPAYQDGSKLVSEQDEGFSEDEAAVVAQRLKDLGYFE